MNLLQVSHSERPRRYFINGRRVSRDHYHDAISTAHGTFLTYVCPKCERAKMSEFRADIGERYDTDEQIEPVD